MERPGDVDRPEGGERICRRIAHDVNAGARVHHRRAIVKCQPPIGRRAQIADDHQIKAIGRAGYPVSTCSSGNEPRLALQPLDDGTPNESGRSGDEHAWSFHRWAKALAIAIHAFFQTVRFT